MGKTRGRVRTSRANTANVALVPGISILGISFLSRSLAFLFTRKFSPRFSSLAIAVTFPNMSAQAGKESPRAR